MRVLMIGDVVGSGGRKAVTKLLRDLRSELSIDFVTLQGENLAAGIGLTVDTVAEMTEAGADVITTGNHVWDKREFIDHLDDPYLPVLRPLNYPLGSPGRGATDDSGPIAVINLIGRVWVGEFDSPFAIVDDLLAGGFGQRKPIVVDFHAEATSEKGALAWHLDGRVAAVVGTHTHVPTSDCKVLPDGTGFVTDLGMVGAVDSILGVEVEGSLNRFLTSRRQRMQPVRSGLINFNSVLIDIDPATGLANSVKRVDRQIEV
ncbi:TIGR00282 family metallophosphoesterase [Candidatus Lucifugimonas marina]|jgi:metallophosphoesterase (TIGR00282 family)|uniref:Metallophosphoesterase n=1 Tax=Candidatus Lucifugimonas marina TaxID=3038979 RepID=A0AAJ5ZFK1_9CHLR|nr:metallophosphoesterase [SAR202 cluster bacterium JH702]MDG0869758.1 metallophosphoesterase [SAR202 cluster bacterium JH639]WFG34486.1 metallophosphoesterase [SAR202 cluster bacterium JH545]WFG38415.1 metallophosphoesterase [SAR202 cluster bacterium JH1073]